MIQYLLAVVKTTDTRILCLCSFLQAYISCTLGIRMVGYVMASWGLATMLSAALLGWLARYTGRRVLCVCALAFDAVIFLVLTRWEPKEDQLHVFLFLAVLMGLVEGVWAVQVNGTWVALPYCTCSNYVYFSSARKSPSYVGGNLCPVGMRSILLAEIPATLPLKQFQCSYY